jgi:muconolactone delta-isomerase
MRFLVKQSFRAPPTKEVLELIPAERAKIKEFAAQGPVEAFYVAADRSGAWIVWNCESQADLEEVQKTLPLHEYVQSDIAMLAD